jgi:hypothetical protein
MRNTFIYILAIFLIIGTAQAQVPKPVNAQNEAIVLKGGIAHLGNGQVINNSIIGFTDGKLTLVSDASTTEDLSKYKVIDVTGQHVYPGFILTNTQLGLSEVSALRATDDTDEVGTMDPNVRSLVAYNTDSKLIPTLRYNGILIAETTPSGGRISGTSSVMNLEGWNWEDAALKADIAIHLNWPNKITSRIDYATFSYIREPNKDYDKQVNELEAFFNDAISYSKLTKKDKNLKLEGMLGLFDGSKTLMIHTDNSKEIIEAVYFAKNHGVSKITLVSGTATLDVSSFLAEHKVPVIIKSIHDLPNTDDMDIYLSYKLPKLLNEAGVTVVLSHEGMLASARNLPFYTGSAVAHGVEKEEAIKFVTLNAAIALGIDKEVGSLEKGKRATLFVSKGDALDMMTNNLSYAFIDGKLIQLENEQQMLYKRYSEKYSQK